MFFKDFVSVKRQKIKRGASQTYDTPSFFGFLYGKGFLGDQRWNRWGRGQEGGKPLPASSCPFLLLPAPLRPFAPRSQRFHRWSPKKKKEKFGS